MEVMLLLQNSRFISQNNKGVGISIDALLALVLFLSMVTLLNVQPVKELSLIEPKIAVNQLMGDAMTALDNNGSIIRALENSTTATELKQTIEGTLDALLPDTIEYRLEFKDYNADLSLECKQLKTFEKCFPKPAETLFTSDTTVPEDRDVFHGRKIFIKKENAWSL